MKWRDLALGIGMGIFAAIPAALLIAFMTETGMLYQWVHGVMP